MRFWYAVIFAAVVDGSAAQDWIQFRGPAGLGISSAIGVPLNWSEDQNVRWKIQVPGTGHSSPVVNASQVWITTSTDQGRSLRVMGFDRESGAVRHDIETFRRSNAEPLLDPNASYASLSPVLDDQRIYASFGPNGVACISTTTGEIIWRNEEFTYQHDKKGVGSSPIIYGDLLIVCCDGLERRRLIALHKHTGKMVWSEDPKNRIALHGMSYSTPIIAKTALGDRLIHVSSFAVTSYNPLTGRVDWRQDIPGNNPVPQPAIDDTTLYVCTGGIKPELWALRLNQPSDFHGGRILWKTRRQVPMVPSPLVVGIHLFWVSDAGIACCADSRTGREIWSLRISGRHFASPPIVGGRIFFCDEGGRTIVCAASDTPQILATNQLVGTFRASAAIAGRALFLRSTTHLYCIKSDE